MDQLMQSKDPCHTGLTDKQLFSKIMLENQQAMCGLVANTYGPVWIMPCEYNRLYGMYKLTKSLLVLTILTSQFACRSKASLFCHVFCTL